MKFLSSIFHCTINILQEKNCNLDHCSPTINLRGGAAALGLGMGLTTPHHKRQACYKKSQWALDLNRFFE
jgi:hypothetical protein